ncbi:hypothetical protein AB0M43_39055 [Longispora sp. NPDC051575]
MKKLWLIVGAAFVAFFIITNPTGAADMVRDITSGVGQFAAGVVGGDR